MNPLTSWCNSSETAYTGRQDTLTKEVPMQGFPSTASENEIALHYERSLVGGETQHAANIKTSHPDLAKRFEAIDERLAAKK